MPKAIPMQIGGIPMYFFIKTKKNRPPSPPPWVSDVSCFPASCHGLHLVRSCEPGAVPFGGGGEGGAGLRLGVVATTTSWSWPPWLQARILLPASDDGGATPRRRVISGEEATFRAGPSFSSWRSWAPSKSYVLKRFAAPPGSGPGRGPRLGIYRREKTAIYGKRFSLRLQSFPF